MIYFVLYTLFMQLQVFNEPLKTRTHTSNSILYYYDIVGIYNVKYSHVLGVIYELQTGDYR